MGREMLRRAPLLNQPLTEEAYQHMICLTHKRKSCRESILASCSLLPHLRRMVADCDGELLSSPLAHGLLHEAIYNSENFSLYGSFLRRG